MTIKLINQCAGGEHLVIDVDGRHVSTTRTELFGAQEQEKLDIAAIKVAVAGKPADEALADLADIHVEVKP